MNTDTLAAIVVLTDDDDALWLVRVDDGLDKDEVLVLDDVPDNSEIDS